MHCPACNHKKTWAVRVRSDGDPTSRTITRLCKNPACGTIFTTLESLLTIVQAPDSPPHMREIASLLGKLSAEELDTVRKFLADLPSRQIPAKKSA